MSDTAANLPNNLVTDSSSEAGKATLAERIGLGLGIALLLFLCFRVFAFVHDDAFITYRYSWNLSHGFGPVFNPGEHTEGYSCPLYMFLTGITMWLPGDVLFRAKIFGMLFSIGALVSAWRLARELDLPPWACAAIPIMLGANPSLALSSIDGMETSFQMMLVTLAALLFVREWRKGSGWLSSLLVLAVALNRAEGTLYLVIALVLRMMDARRRGFDKRDKTWLAVTLLPIALFFVWRHSYFGWWMPNTYYAKNMPIESVIDFGMGPAYALRTLFVNLNSRVVLVVISSLLWLAALAGSVSERIRSRNALILPLFVAAQLVVAMRAGGDWMQGWRYMMAVVPLWTILICVGLAEPGVALAKAGKAAAGRGLGLAGVVVYFGICLWAMTDYHSVGDGIVSWADQGWATDSHGLLRNYRMENTLITADILNKRLPAGSLVAFSEVGAVPYFTPNLRWLDTCGLVDSGIAHLPGLTRFRTGVTGDYTSTSSAIGKEMLRRKPDFIIRWDNVETLQTSILDGNYAPYFRAPVKSLFGRPGDYVVQVWKRAF